MSGTEQLEETASVGNRTRGVAYPTVFHGHRWVDSSDATVHVGSVALRYAVSVFEGVRLYVPAGVGPPVPFRLDAHLARLRNSLGLMRLSDPGTAALPGIVDELVRVNEIDGDAYVRIAVTASSIGDLGDETDSLLTVVASPMGRKKWLSQDVGMRLVTSPWQRATPAVFPPAAKNISNYAGPRLAHLDAKAAGFDGCLLTTRDGTISEAPTAAFFLVQGTTLVTPPLDDNILPSITRRWVIDVAESVGLQCREQSVSRFDAHVADEAFLCGTGIEFASIESLDSHRLRAWPAHPMTDRITERYFGEVRGERPPAVGAERLSVRP